MPEIDLFFHGSKRRSVDRLLFFVRSDGNISGDRVQEIPREVPLDFLPRYHNQLERIGVSGDGRKPILCARPHHHPMLGFRFNHHVFQFSKYDFGICPFSFVMDNGSKFGVTMPPDRLMPLVMGELVRQIPCSREIVDCEDGFQWVPIGDDSQCKLADDFGVWAILRQVFQGM